MSTSTSQLQRSGIPFRRRSKTLGVRAPERTGGQALVDRLAREMADRWQRGERPLVEEFLQLHPKLRDEPQAVLRLIYEEFCLRQEAGEADAFTRLLERFPNERLELELLLDCQRLMIPQPDGPLVAAGQAIGDFHLLAELGRGGQGKVFLATQPALADRPVVVKLSTCAGNEHLTLARLQHTHIVPLYAAQEDLEHNLRILCMPYLGGASLAAILQAMRTPSVRASGRDLLEALDRLQAALPLTAPARGKVRSWLAGARYEEVVCWMGACLADALHYAHERGLVHLDLTSSNVLVTAEGLPMLLDFHLSRSPIPPSASGAEWMGGTPGYMAPEHAQAFLALTRGEPAPGGVDQRADIYSLGMVLYEALGGPVPEDLTSCWKREPLRRYNHGLSVGLADVVARCLAVRPEDRYQSAADLAADLRRHLAGLPLREVANRSLVERWRKWRRRRPYTLALLGALFALLLAGLAGLDHVRRQHAEARAALERGQELLARGQYGQSLEHLERGRALAGSLPLPGDLFCSFDRSVQDAREGLAAGQRRQTVVRLHTVVEQLRMLAVAESLPEQQVRSLEQTCRELWETRDRLLDAGRDENLDNDLLDLAVIWADLMTRPCPEPVTAARRQEALQILAEAEKLHPASPVLQWARRQASAPGQAVILNPPTKAWEHLIIGRSLLAAGRFEEARAELVHAIDLEPQHFWAHYYRGVASSRQGRAAEAVEAFSVCLALSPGSSACYHNRALAQAELGTVEQALRDYTHALELDPDLSAAAFNRGVLHARGKRYREALRDFQYALDHGADPVAVRPALLQVQRATDEER
jgi:eukaryotic-like serine/threonine-protein kinase